MAFDGSDPLLQVALPMAIEGILWRSQNHLQCSLAVADGWPTFQVRRLRWPKTEQAFPRHLEYGRIAVWPANMDPAFAHWQQPKAHELAVDACRFHYHQHLLFLGFLRQVSMVCKSWYVVTSKRIPTACRPPRRPEWRPGDPDRQFSSRIAAPGHPDPDGPALPAVPEVVHCTYPFRLELNRELGSFDPRLIHNPQPVFPELKLSRFQRTALQSLLIVASHANEVDAAEWWSAVSWDRVELLAVCHSCFEFETETEGVRHPERHWHLARHSLKPAEIDPTLGRAWFCRSHTIVEFLTSESEGAIQSLPW